MTGWVDIGISAPGDTEDDYIASLAELFEQECLAFAPATDYSQWEFACQ